MNAIRKFFTCPITAQVEKSGNDLCTLLQKMQKLWTAAVRGLTALPAEVAEQAIGLARQLAGRPIETRRREKPEDALIQARLWVMCRDPLVLVSGTLRAIARELSDYQGWQPWVFEMFKGSPRWATLAHIAAARKIVSEEWVWTMPGGKMLVTSLADVFADTFRKHGWIEAAAGRVELLELHSRWGGDSRREGHEPWCGAAFRLEEVILLARSPDPRARAVLDRISQSMIQTSHLC